MIESSNVGPRPTLIPVRCRYLGKQKCTNQGNAGVQEHELETKQTYLVLDLPVGQDVLEEAPKGVRLQI